MSKREYIVVNDGIEGSGKSSLMTADNLAFLKRGGKLLTFPGYDVYNDDGEVISEQIDIAKLLNMLLSEELRNVRVSMDEMENWLDSYESQSQIAKILVAIAQQRRKMNIGMYGTINPSYEWLPRKFRGIFQILNHCEDMHFITKGAVPEGTLFRITTIDMLGLITGKPGKRLRPRMFYGKPYRKHFKSYSVVDIQEKWTRVKVNKRVIEVDLNGDGESDGEFVPKPGGLDIPLNRKADQAAQYILNEYIKNGNDEILVADMHDAVLSQGVDISKHQLKKIMNKFGWDSATLTRKGNPARYYIPA